MAITQLIWEQIQPNIDNAPDIFTSASGDVSPLALQSRLLSGLDILCPTKRRHFDHQFMLIKASDSHLMLSLLQSEIKSRLPENNTAFAYHINEHKVTLTETQNRQDNFAASDSCLAAQWVESEILFGCVRQPDDETFKLQAGLVHKANGGVLIIGLQSLLDHPMLWLRLKNMVLNREYQWFSNDDSHPLPFSIPPLPLDLRIILVGDRVSLSDLQEFDPDFYQTALYAEFEEDLFIDKEQVITDWASYLKAIAKYQNLPELDGSAYNPIMKAATRYLEDQYYFPLSPDWVNSLLSDAARYADNVINGEAIEKAIQQKDWREGYLLQRFREQIYAKQIMINTQDQIVGQINGLSVIEYPGYPKAIGEPTRLSCVVHFGDGEFIDIERKNELAGNIHSKGMMIMQSFITSEFALQHQLPFSASLVFEQSYNEVDGDSASLASLCVLMSALAEQPIDQQLAVTGSVDQFGNIQPIGGINEKIEGFYAVCKNQGLTGQQGVVIPASNSRHLCLSDEVLDAIKNEQFSIWTVEHVSEALYLLTGIEYKNKSGINLYTLIQTRIQQMLSLDRKQGGLFSKWFK
ncbi:AAA family ATPase [Zophobihabitans entericus]|uniref:AAA family ATPase n=1 Tax=Zophobihabitans entericus TaxID=1635327 RepID=UPI001AAEA2BA|nr:Lon protease family protein [Zophobihabitans entericus]